MKESTAPFFTTKEKKEKKNEKKKKKEFTARVFMCGCYGGRRPRLSRRLKTDLLSALFQLLLMRDSLYLGAYKDQ